MTLFLLWLHEMVKHSPGRKYDEKVYQFQNIKSVFQKFDTKLLHAVRRYKTNQTVHETYETLKDNFNKKGLQHDEKKPIKR